MSARGISILGSTGSIGCNTLRVIEALGPENFRVVALAAGRNFEKLAEQIARHQPELVSVESEEIAEKLQADLRRRDVSTPRMVIGEAGLVEVATQGPSAQLVLCPRSARLKRGNGWRWQTKKHS